ncbi:MAG: polysaccharide biosynthesis protein [Cryomorphaceae bacterium]|nr:polysaccharide biosynthesis protein [Cryomorphaceae bacterium]
MNNRVIICGLGKIANATRECLESELFTKFEVVAIIYEDSSVQEKLSGDILHVGLEEALQSGFIVENNIHQLIIADPELSFEKRKMLIECCLELKIHVRIVPPLAQWIKGKLTNGQILGVEIEDLLERDAINLNSKIIGSLLQNKTICITGAAGSIGSEILRQVLHYSPAKVIAIDQAESALYEVEMDLLHNRTNHHGRTDFVIADITREERMEKLFEQYNPEIIFHAAAYKHVPLMEAHPYEAVKVNVFGTKTVVDLAVRFGVEKFVMVSTDKAVNPTNVMGASKRIAEMYVQSFCKDQYDTKFITTRFGNVLGSNGSVIPLFRKQIGRGGPVTITHPDITRYFMTIPEACNLVLEAGAMGSGGEIFVFDMGESVKIADLARNMIRLSGLELGQDIEIKYTGLRPGEKLYEELLATNEGTRPTHHDKIMIADIRHVDKEHIEYMLKAMHEALNTAKPEELVRLMKQMVKEFKSNNSIFAKLD